MKRALVRSRTPQRWPQPGEYRPVQPWVGDNQTCQQGLLYREFRVPAPYREFFPVVWMLSSPPHARSTACKYHVIPDGCSDLIFDLQNGGGSIFGTLSRAQTVNMSGPVRILGVRMAPHVAPALIGLPATEIRDFTPTFEEAGQMRLLDLLDEFADRPMDDSVSHRLVTRLASCLHIERLKAAGKRMLPALMATGGCVDAAARSMGMCSRQLHRVCLRELGLPPKLLSRVLRVQRALPALMQPGASSAAVAADFGFTDQSHMIREYIALTGYSPEFWRKRGMSDLSNTATSLSGRVGAL